MITHFIDRDAERPVGAFPRRTVGTRGQDRGNQGMKAIAVSC